MFKFQIPFSLNHLTRPLPLDGSTCSIVYIFYFILFIYFDDFVFLFLNSAIFTRMNRDRMTLWQHCCHPQLQLVNITKCLPESFLLSSLIAFMFNLKWNWMRCISIECCNVLANLTTKQKREVLSIILKKVQETLLLWLLVFLFVSEGCPSEDVRVNC